MTTARAETSNGSRVNKPSREQHWRELVEQYGASGLRMSEFCRRQGVPLGTMSWWRSELKRRDGKKPKRTKSAKRRRRVGRQTFIPVKLAPSVSSEK